MHDDSSESVITTIIYNSVIGAGSIGKVGGPYGLGWSKNVQKWAGHGAPGPIDRPMHIVFVGL